VNEDAGPACNTISSTSGGIDLDKYVMTVVGDTISLKRDHLNKTLVKSFRLTEIHFAMIEGECRRCDVVFSEFVRKATLAAVNQAERRHDLKAGERLSHPRGGKPTDVLASI
jgi:hypothetical protein